MIFLPEGEWTREKGAPMGGLLDLDAVPFRRHR
jgi:hypothetical protein